MGYAWIKAALIALIAANTAVYVRAGTTSEGLDSAAWLVLLLSFELETGPAGRWIGSRTAVLARGCRLVAAAALVVATLGYFRDAEWLDAANMALWIAVVALLEAQVRHPRAAARYRTAFRALAAVTYSALAALALAWGWRGEWFDAYDALLWLVAFAMIEMNIFRKAGPVPAPARAG
jgi:hypothetical protein